VVDGELPLGEEIQWTPVKAPVRAPLRGSHVTLRPLTAMDAQSLYAISHPPDGDLKIWTYLPDGPYESEDHMRQTLAWAESAQDMVYFAIVPVAEGRSLGVASYLRIKPEFGVLEIGHIWFGAGLRRTTAASEAIYLLLGHVFDDLGYRRVEWKCNALNAASRRAAERFGFTFEGVFRKAQVVKGRNRDTAWYAITDEEWPAIREAFQGWLAPENFDGEGAQKQDLKTLIDASRA
jgi:RimJ/RimL family protein N-acetyltransferase